MCDKQQKQRYARYYLNLMCRSDAVKRQLRQQACQPNPLWRTSQNYAQQQCRQLPCSSRRPIVMRETAGTELNLRLKSHNSAGALSQKEPTDADVVFGTYSRNLYKRCNPHWERPRLEWLYELEREPLPPALPLATNKRSSPPAQVSSPIGEPVTQPIPSKFRRFWRLLCCAGSVDMDTDTETT